MTLPPSRVTLPPSRLMRLTVFLSLAVSAPLWLLLRTWYGYRFLLLLLLAAFAWPALLHILEGAFFPNMRADLLIRPFHTLELLLAGCIWQLVLTSINALRISLFDTPLPHPAFAGSFLLTPSPRRNVPLDFIPLIALIYCYVYGVDIAAPPLPEALRELPWLNFIAHGLVIKPQEVHPAGFLMVTAYVLLVLSSSANRGRLRCFDWGPMPEQPPKRVKKAAIEVARPLPAARGVRGGLKMIFSQRHPALTRMASLTPPPPNHR